MAINKKLITFDKKSTFLGANGINNVSSPTDGYYHNIPEWSMVFILETGEIWHNGKYFGKPIKDQIFPATSQLTKGIVFMNNDDYYYRSFNLWGNVFDGSVRDINGELVVQGETYKWTYGDGVIRKSNTNLIAFSGLSGVYDVFIPSGDLSVTGGDLKVGNNITLASTGSIKGTHTLNTNSYFNLDYSLGKTWNSIKLFNTSGTLISLDSTRPAIINIQAGVYASGTNWQPWITGGDVTELSSWGIGLGGDAFYIGRIDKTNTENSLSQYWKFDSEDGITISGTTKYIKVDDLAGASEKIFLADGTVKALSELMSNATIGEATTTNYGGFKLTQSKSSSQQTLVSNTIGNGRYAVKMNADGTLFVEFVLANTWLPATNTQGGYVPQLSTGNNSIDSNLNDYVLTFTDSSDETIYPTWKRLPSTSFENTWREIKVNGTQKRSTATNSGDLNFINGTNTSVEWTEDNKLKINAVNTWNAFTAATSEAAGTAGYIQAPAGALNKFFRGDNTWLTINLNVTSALYVGASNGTGNSAQSTNGNVYLIFAEGSSYSRYKIVGSGRASVTSDASGNITINSSGYSNFGAATASAAGSAGLVPAPGANVLGTGGYFLRADGSWVVPTNTWKAANSSQEGYVPKLNGSGTIGTQSTEYVLTFTSGGTGTITPTWKLLPANAFVNTWTAWKGATDSANGTAGYMPAPTSAQRGQFLRGDGSWVSLNNYSLPTASKDTLGGVKTGAAITDTTGYTAVAIKNGVIYYKDTNTTYSFSNLLFQQTSGTNLMTYNSQAVRTVLAGSNITFTHSNNVLTIAAKDTTYSTVSKTAAGLCPTLPNETTTTKYLRLDGSWLTPPDNNTWKAANASLEGYVPKSKANKILRANADGALYWGDDANTTYTFYNLLFQNSGGTTVDTYKPTTKPTKTLKAGSNVTISAESNVITIASTNTNTWRGILDNLTSSSNTTESLSAKQGYLLANGSARDNTKLPLSGGTLSNSSFGSQLIIERSGSANMAAIGFKNSSGILGYLATNTVNGAFVRYNAAVSTYYTILDSSNSSVSKSGETLTVKINGTSQSLTNTNTWNAMKGATSSANGTVGYVNATPPKNGYNTKFLRADGTWSVPAYPTKSSWNYNDMYVASVSISGNNLRINKNGANTDLTIPYASSAGSATYASYLTLTYCRSDSNSGLWNTIKNGSSNTVTNKVNFYTIYNDGGPTTYGEMLEILSYNANHWLPLLWFGAGKGGHMYYRNKNYNDNSWGNWLTILDSGNSSVSKSGETLTVKINGTSQSLTNTNTWRGILNNLTSDSTTDSLSAALGKALNNKFGSYLPLSGGTMTGNLSFSNSGTGFRGINYGTMGDNDQWRIGGAATGSNGGYMEIATADDGNEPIYVRQYTGVFSTLKRTATLLDGSGNTSFPGTVSASSFSGTIAWSNVSSKPATATRWPSWSEVTSKPSTFAPSSGSSYYMTRDAWHSSGNGDKVDNLICGTSFYYANHGAPTNGVVAAFSGTHASYQLQIQGNYSGRAFYYRTKNGDNGNWNAWTQVIDTANIGSQSVNYANSAGSVAWSNVTSKPGSTGGATTPVYWNGSGFTKCTAYGSASVNYANSAGAVAWSNVSSKPINFKAYTGSLASGGWKTMQGKDSHPSIAISYNNGAASWNSGTYSATLVYGCNDTRGLLDCAYNTPIVTFGGCSYGGANDNNPTWYMKITGTSGTTYNLNSMPYASSAGNADTVDSQHFKWSNDSNSPTYLWAANSSGTAFLCARGSMSVNYANSAGSVAWGNVSSKPFNWSGKSGQPTWLWGSNDGSNYYVWNPSNFSVNYATSAGSGKSGQDFLVLNGYFISKRTNSGMDGNGFTVQGISRTISFAIGSGNVNRGIYDSTAGKWILMFDASSTYLDFGNVYAPNYYVNSDRNKKHNIRNFSEHIRLFTLNDTGKDMYGVVAQEVAPMFREGEEGHMTVNYSSVLAYYVGILENKNKELEGKVSKLESEIEWLKSKVN